MLIFGCQLLTDQPRFEEELYRQIWSLGDAVPDVRALPFPPREPDEETAAEAAQPFNVPGRFSDFRSLCWQARTACKDATGEEARILILQNGILRAYPHLPQKPLVAYAAFPVPAHILTPSGLDIEALRENLKPGNAMAVSEPELVEEHKMPDWMSSGRHG